jgi:hypothetical protein
MIKDPTVFILGAGASCPFGFPSGDKLLRDLAVRASLGAVDTTAFAASWRGDELKNFRKLLHESAPQSIDDFLQDHKDQFLRLGKLALARELIQYEQHSMLCSLTIQPHWKDGDQHWLRLLWSKIRPPADDPEALLSNCVSFIVYNYDRCVEHFLTVALASTCRLTWQYAYEIVGRLQIIHPHGLLAPYWPLSPEMPGRPRAGHRHFDATQTESAMELAANHIHLFWEEGQEQQKARAAMRAALGPAKAVVFLGFGFLKSNMESLRPMLPVNNVEVYGTTLGLGPIVTEGIAHSFPGSSDGFAEVDCYRLLKDRVPLGD